MKCPKCGFENIDIAKFCNECGIKLEIPCPNCGTANQPGSRFCFECGHNLTLPSGPALKTLSFDEKIDKIQRYLPKGLTGKILSQRDKIEGERKQVTVMFCDMEGFTGLSEKAGPEEAFSIMDQVYEILIHKVHDYEGTVNEMTGDGIMALFGAPIALEDAPQRAVRSALAIHREIAKFSDKLRHEKESISPIKMRIGIHTGPVVVGTLGNNLRVEFKAVGDTVNLASRIEGLAEPGTTWVSSDTFMLTEGLFRFEALGEKAVKGKEDPISVYRVIASSTRKSKFDVSSERGLTPFVGRERELEQLMDGFERCKEARGQAFSIVSEAGVGKSRLLYEFRKAVVNENVTFLEGKCLSYSRNVAYHPVTDILKSNFDILGSDGELEIRKKVIKGLEVLKADETSTLPYLLELISVKDSGIELTTMSPEIRRKRIIETLTQIVLKGSEIRPLIMAFEDLHWIDTGSEESLKHLLESISGAKVILIFTYRPEFVHTWGGRSYHSQINLNRLSNRESLMMVSHLLGTEELDADLETLILEKTEGVPFFIEEFITSLKNLKIIERENRKYHLVKKLQDMTIPNTIQDVIMARVDSLPEEAKELLQRGSVIEREFSHDLIKELVELSEQELLSNLSILKDSELLYERGIYPESIYIFKHALTREVVYDSILTTRKRRLHEEIGQTIEVHYNERLEEFYEMLAHHYLKSEDLEKAYKYLKLSGDKATRNFANQEAYRFYKEAIETLNKRPSTEESKKEQINIRLSICTPIELLSCPEDSFQILQDAVRVAEEIGDTKNAVIFLSKLGNYYTIMGDKLKAIKYSAKGFEEAEKNDDIDLMVTIGSELMISTGLYGDATKTVNIASKLVRVLEKNHKESEFFGRPFNSYSESHVACGYNLALLGKFKEGEKMGEKGLRYAKDIEHLPSIVEALFFLTYLFVEKADGRNVIEYGEIALKYCKEAEVNLLVPLLNSLLGFGYFYLGEFQTSRKLLKGALQLQKNMGLQMNMSIFYLGLGQLEMESRNFETAQNNIEYAIDYVKKNNERIYEGISWTILGSIKGKIEPAEYDGAEECILKGIKVIDGFKLRPHLSRAYLYLGDLYNDMGRKDEASKSLKMAEQMFKEMEMVYWLKRTQEVLARL